MELTHIVVVSDMTRSSDWYRDALGAELELFSDPDGHLFEISQAG